MKFSTIYKILLLSLIVFQQLVAQNGIDNKIAGVLTDSLTKGVLPNATVMFMRNDTLVIGLKSKVDGSFIIKQRTEGKYTVKIQYVGYNTKSISIDLKNQDIDLGMINLTLSQIALSEVTVVGKKPFIEFLDDRISMNVSESITGVGGNVITVVSSLSLPWSRVPLTTSNGRIAGTGSERKWSVKTRDHGKGGLSKDRRLRESGQSMRPSEDT